MIDKLRPIAIFANVVEQGSFRAAARHLGLAPSRVSQTVSDLEKDLGVTLLYRSTRQISVTHEGRLLHQKAMAILEAAETGLDQINPHATEPRGSLRVTVPAFITQTKLMDVFAAFAKTYPKVHLQLHFTDHATDLIKEGFDVGIRAGWPETSELLSRSIGGAERLLAVSPDYCKGRDLPQHPSELEEWDWIRFLITPNQTELTSRSGVKVNVRINAYISVNSAQALYEFALRGLGIASIPEHLAQQGFARGDLIPILPEWSLKPLGIYALWPDQSRRENLTLLFVRFLAEQSEPKL
ncbi:MAG: LysR family transcriptional regulator [Pseudomonadota bacterium]